MACLQTICRDGPSTFSLLRKDTINYSILTMRTAKSFTIEEDVDAYVSATKGEGSASERVNELLRRAILQEQAERLEREAAAFFANPRNTARKETRAFQKASIRTLSRD